MVCSNSSDSDSHGVRGREVDGPSVHPNALGAQRFDLLASGSRSERGEAVCSFVFYIYNNMFIALEAS